MKLKYIVAVERKNLTEQDEVRLLDMDGTEYGSEQLFKVHLQDSIAYLQGDKWLELNLPTESDRYSKREFDVQVWGCYVAY